MTDWLRCHTAHLEILLSGSPAAAWSQPVVVKVLCLAGRHACFAAGAAFLTGLVLGNWDAAHLWKLGVGTALLFLLRLYVRSIQCPSCHRFYQWESFCKNGHSAGKPFAILRCRCCGCICKTRGLYHRKNWPPPIS